MVLLCGVTALLAVSCGLGTPEFKDVKAEELKRMMDSGTLLMIVDTRIHREYREGRLPGAVNIPPHKFMRIEQYLPREKDTRIVFYCRGFG
jgi:rhodanese-related sulfurtransferase